MRCLFLRGVSDRGRDSWATLKSRHPGEVLEDWMVEQRGAVAADIETGFAQVQRGERIDGDAAVENIAAPTRAAKASGVNTPFHFTSRVGAVPHRRRDG
jgi:hypothetical protein